MVNNIKTEFDNILHSIHWMDEETKQNAYGKSQMMNAIVGYPEELKNDTLVNRHYNTVRNIIHYELIKRFAKFNNHIQISLSTDHFENNIRILRKWARDREFSRLRRVNDPHKYYNEMKEL